MRNMGATELRQEPLREPAVQTDHRTDTVMVGQLYALARIWGCTASFWWDGAEIHTGWFPAPPPRFSLSDRDVLRLVCTEFLTDIADSPGGEEKLFRWFRVVR